MLNEWLDNQLYNFNITFTEERADNIPTKAASKANQALGMIKQNFNICPKAPLQNICPTILRVLCPNLEPSLL